MSCNGINSTNKCPVEVYTKAEIDNLPKEADTIISNSGDKMKLISGSPPRYR